MFSISRRLHSQSQPPMAQRLLVPVPDFLTQESDADLRNITMTAMQAERKPPFLCNRKFAASSAVCLRPACLTMKPADLPNSLEPLYTVRICDQSRRSAIALQAGAAKLKLQQPTKHSRMSIESNSVEAELSAEASAWVRYLTGLAQVLISAAQCLVGLLGIHLH